MLIKTSVPVLLYPDKIVDNIAAFWDKISLSWRTIIGPHIHHGYYSTAKISFVENAQEILLEKLCAEIVIKRGMQILDVGCGMGETSLYLARKYGARMIGITLSQEQKAMACQLATENKELDLDFRIDDAHLLKSIAENSQDLVWSLESCEQFYDKEEFIKQAFRVLKPGGQLMIATWCADKEHFEGNAAKRYYSICKEFLLPYMPTKEEYNRIIQVYFTVNKILDWSQQVKQSWSLGIAELKKHSWLKLIKLGGLTGFRFIRSLSKMNKAFLMGQLRYAVFIAVKKAE